MNKPKYKVGDKLEKANLRDDIENDSTMQAIFPDGPPCSIVLEVVDLGGPEPYYQIQNLHGIQTIVENDLIPWGGTKGNLQNQVAANHRNAKAAQEISDMYDKAEQMAKETE